MKKSRRKEKKEQPAPQADSIRLETYSTRAGNKFNPARKGLNLTGSGFYLFGKKFSAAAN